MNQELVASLVRERQARRRRDAEVERLVNSRTAVCMPVSAGRWVRAWRRALGFRLVELGLRAALGGGRC